ncbi:alkene reductase [Flavobacterium weaverense]|uniref:N-ethylmaleimide reductase n=1 Tax=Flavobacterium weaverense TaxID=271156 RepID=A0A3L9ZXL7_9FLAO|nr:alkene reductase [Flavobacterium weaverense]RMA75145.1 N-ethylmaleimide reductase [Flavobacterium weaverense]
MSKSLLFQPYTLGDIILNNRVVMAPMTRSRSNNEGNVATDLTARYYEQRATAGLIITEGTFVSTKAVGFINVPGIYSEAQIEGWKLVTKAVHDKGGKIFAQLWHTGRLSHPDLHAGELPHAPSALNPFAKAFTNDGFVDTVVPKEMTIEDINQTVLDFTNGAKNALAAGFDGVELHAANGYLLQQFFNRYSNHRTDDYGGSMENKSRILFDILNAFKGVIDYSKVGVRLNPSLNNAQGMMLDKDTIPTHEYIVKRLNDYGLAYIHLTEPFTPVDDIPFAVTEVAKHFRPLYNGTLIINKSFTKETGIKVIEDGYADLVAYGVPFIANPDLVARFEADAPLNAPDQATFYTPTEKGYTDYPSMTK